MFEIKNKYLPWSGNRYIVTLTGTVTYANGEIIESREINGEWYVELEWILGKKDYLVGLLVLINYNRLKLPAHLYKEVTILYIDNDKTNLAPINLLYKYKCGGLQVEEFPGFYYIPFYNDYAISYNGELINIKTSKYKVWSITKGGGPKNQTGGYRYSRVVNDEGFSTILFLHRALCYVFKDYSSNVMSLVVNHKDGVPSNNYLDNFEWSTYSENNQHAYDTGLRSNAAKVLLMKNLKTNEVQRFESIDACARSLGYQSSTFIKWRLNNSPTKVYPDLLLFKFDDDSIWPDIDIKNVDIYRGGVAIDFIARNVFTGELINFEGSDNGFKLTGVNPATILSHSRENKLLPINGFNFRYLTDKVEWPQHTANHLRIYEKYPAFPPDGVICIDQKTKEETFFLSINESSTFFNITPNRLRNIINSNLIYKNQYLIKYFKLKESLSPIDQ